MPLHTLRPMLEVQDMSTSLSFYENVLGFQVVDRLDDRWALLKKDGIALMLSERYTQAKHPQPLFTGSLYFYTDEVDAQWEALKESVEIAYPIESFDYGMREFAIYDPNGYLLQWGQEIPAL